MYPEIVIFVVPLLIGYVLTFLKIEALHEFTENIHIWLNRHLRNIHSGKSKTSKIERVTTAPLYSLFITINDLTSNISNIGVKSGIRIAAYLYLIGFLIFIFMILGHFLFLLALITISILLALLVVRYISKGRKKVTSKGISGKHFEGQSITFVESIWPLFRTRVTKEKVEELFDVEKIEVDYEGDIFAFDLSSPSAVRIKIGCVDKNGGIYDTRKETPEKIGSIDTLGRVIDERRLDIDDLFH